MSEVDLAALSGPQLRGLLDSARMRGDAALSYAILQEMAARRDPGSRAPRRRSRSEPRIVSVNLGDPADAEDDLPPMPAWRPPPRGVEASEGAAIAQIPLSSEDFEAVGTPAAERPASAGPAPDRDLGAPGLTLERPAPPRRRRSGRLAALAGVAAVSAAGGVGIGWFLGGTSREAASASAASGTTPALTIAPEHQPAPAADAAALTAAAPSAAAQPASQTPAQPAATQAAAPQAEPEPPLTEGDLASPEPSQAPAAGHDADAIKPEPASHASSAQTAASGHSACAAAPTPADRAICGDPELQRLQRELRQAYAEALEAHEDKALLRQRQLAWREARNAIADPERLALAYQERIQKLKAATADARKQR